MKTVEDLEKLLFVWQEATEISSREVKVEMGSDIVTDDGMRYSEFAIRRK